MRIGAFRLDEPLPELRSPHALVSLRPWLDAGRAGRHTLVRLERHLAAQEIGRLAWPHAFYDYTRYRPRVMNVGYERRINIPNTTILYATCEQPPDFLFLHLLEPHASGEDYVESVLEVLKQLRVEKYVQLGAVADSVPHTRPLLLSGVLSGEEGERLEIRSSKYEGPTSIAYLIAEQAPQLGIEVATLLVHLPIYAQLDEDYSGVSRLVEVLCDLYSLPKHLIDGDRGRGQYQQIDAVVSRNPQAQSLVQKLEANYDARSGGPVPPSDRSLSPEVERFLGEMNRRFSQEEEA